ncbi:bidirectional hydrogenase complex protein HoxU [Desulfopila aestuarii]|uniref:NAD(P)-dependent nickel-iron dehydrogenase diaphorase component subunit HoxU n=1 Tax=Desulfopila aestuarii DSM 18488 TaxID=1121416 RepID=A0A1M7YKR9_9BACT|nr:bidirectional hydrogenase complex protein HoxU [Desulfopila aestuarii]SHO53209.1 NAD(P)-dependent nickel-iron dehydrogenase diaphorase component subunit HoxU [Desulfopila aestuarii DSM 18488]
MTSGTVLPRKRRVRPVGSHRILTFKINNRDVSSREDESILAVARQNNIYIPTLCHLDGLSEHGACRLCIVEIKNAPKLVPACITFPQEGMEVSTCSERVIDYRKKLLEMLFTERNHVCAVCVSNGHCELQDLAIQLNITHVRYEYLYPRLALDGSHPRFIMDHNRCVLCLRCVRVCDEIEGAHTWDVMNRGLDTRVITDLNIPWGSSETCTSCGKCVQVCPTGALSEKGKSVAEMVKRRQFLPYLQKMRRWEEE